MTTPSLAQASESTRSELEARVNRVTELWRANVDARAMFLKHGSEANLERSVSAERAYQEGAKAFYAWCVENKIGAA